MGKDYDGDTQPPICEVIKRRRRPVITFKSVLFDEPITNDLNLLTPA